MLGRALVAGLAVAFASPAVANPVASVMSVISDVCLSHGGDADAVQSLAAARGWPALSDDEVEAIPWLGERPPFLAAWWVSRGERPIAFVIGTGAYTYWRSNRNGGARYSSFFAPESGTADAQIPPELHAQTDQVCTLFFGIDNPALLEDRLRVLDVDGVPLFGPSVHYVHRGARGVEGEMLVSSWLRPSAIIIYSFVPDLDEPRATVEVIVPLVKAPDRQWPPLLR